MRAAPDFLNAVPVTGFPQSNTPATCPSMAGLTVALLAKNDPFLAAASASFVTKAAGNELYKKVGVNYNCDDLADKIPEVLAALT